MTKTLKDHNFFDFDATMVADSTNEFNTRLSTMVVTFPRYILAELNTHRLFSRNSASSRAIRFEKMLEMLQKKPFVPIAFQKDHKGMQGTEYFEGEEETRLRNAWYDARWFAMEQAEKLSGLGLTKQLVNRVVEPFLWHTVIVSATEWENFFDLRCPKYKLLNGEIYRSKKDSIADNEFNVEGQMLSNVYQTLDWLKINEGMADIHMMEIAEKMWDCRNESIPKLLQAGEWHIPFENEIHDPKIYAVLQEELGEEPEQPIWANRYWEIKRKLSRATCARISFGNINLEGRDYEKECQFADTLVANEHWSPTEHVAQNMNPKQFESFVKGELQWDTDFNDESLVLIDPQFDPENPDDYDISKVSHFGWCNNFRGFIQERYFLEQNNK